MKKSIIIMIFSLVLCGCMAVVASALDTPMLPISPDKPTTENAPPSENENGDANGDTDGGEENGENTEKNDEEVGEENTPPINENESNTSTPDEGGSENSAKSDFENADSSAVDKNGCGSVLGGCAALVCCTVATACVIKSRKENE